MIKRLSLFCLISLIAVFSASAQAAGTWNIMPVYGGAAEKLVDGHKLVYYLSKGHLFSYNKDTDESIHYSTVNNLNDVDVKLIAYNPYKRYLAVVYSSYNIDLLYDNGRVVNIPDIRDADISANKTVNAVEFTPDGRMYVATGFGFVAFDDEKHRVADSGIYNTSFSYAGEIGGHIVLGQGNNIYASPKDIRHNSFDTFKKIGTLAGTGAVFHRLGDRLLLARNTLKTSSNKYYLLTPDFDKGTVASSAIDNGVLRMDFVTGNDESVRFASGTVIRTVGTDGSIVSQPLPSDFYGKTLTTSEGRSSIWVSDTRGVAEYSVTDDATTQLHAPIKPESLTCYWPAIMRISRDGKRIYVSNMGYDQFRSQPNITWSSIPQTTDIIENGNVRDVAVYDSNGKNVIIGATQDIIEDPDDADTYYVVNDIKGIYIIKNGEIKHIFDSSNAPFPAGNRSWVFNADFDNFGNMWIGMWVENGRKPIYILPADKLKNPKNVTKNDWIVPALNDYNQSSGVVSLHHSRSNYCLYGASHNVNGLLLLDHKGTPTDISDDIHYVFSNYYDQDGNQVKMKRIMSISEDNNGQIWVCHESGVFVIPDIKSAVKNGSLHVRRPKVARNDGTSYADYLLDGEHVYACASDPSDRKWLTTLASGVYLINADGTQIIEHFSTENSVLPSNKVLSVMCDPYSNAVYFGTDKGVVCYNSNATPPAEDYSDVYAYPNPVRPDYTGWITITGLMDSSLVKITDTAGNLVHQGTSEGGMYMWNGCDNSNRRVRSGVYYVFASQNASGSASGKPVTKIMVIN